jgi:pyridine nucleotide-disulfide oxidoreductase domain-containing protein 1
MDFSNSMSHSETSQNIMMNTKRNINNSQNNKSIQCTFLIVGGGIAGVSCAETIKFLQPNEKIIILCESSLIKSVTNLVQLGKYVTQFEVKEIDSRELGIQIVQDKLTSINSKQRFVSTEGGQIINFNFLCLCTGARPKLIPTSENIDNFILGIRDTDSVKEFQKKIKNGNKFILVGNGGIASEIAYEIKNIEIDWIIKDQHISSTFVDAGAAKFFENRLKNKDFHQPESTIIKRMRYTEDKLEYHQKGAALGPDWHRLVDMSGSLNNTSDNVTIHHGVEILKVSNNIDDSSHPIIVELTNNKRILSDFIISATGVNPSIDFKCDEEFKIGTDGGIVVDELMKTSVEGIYAAGDVCCAGWEKSKFWHQMRLWTQARQMGMMAGKSMAARNHGEEIYQDFCFELFSHVTKLYGYKVVMLGKFNCQGFEDNDYELLFRITPGEEYIKFVLHHGRLVGALLIGETNLEETCENLILNEIDLTPYGDDILNPNIDIEDYFD